jgi:hypothetical protein
MTATCAMNWTSLGTPRLDCTMLNGTMTDELEKIWKEAITANQCTIPASAWSNWRKPWTVSAMITWWPSQDLNQIPPNYKSRVLSLAQQERCDGAKWSEMVWDKVKWPHWWTLKLHKKGHLAQPNSYCWNNRAAGPTDRTPQTVPAGSFDVLRRQQNIQVRAAFAERFCRDWNQNLSISIEAANEDPKKTKYDSITTQLHYLN